LYESLIFSFTFSLANASTLSSHDIHCLDVFVKNLWATLINCHLAFGHLQFLFPMFFLILDLIMRYQINLRCLSSYYDAIG